MVTTRSLINTQISLLAKLPLGISRVQRIKLKDGLTLPVHHKTLLFKKSLRTLASTLSELINEVEGFDIALGLHQLCQNTNHVNQLKS